MYTVAAVQIARNAETIPLKKNFPGSVIPNDSSAGSITLVTCGQKLPQTMPSAQRIDPVIAAAHAAGVVPLRQYNPPRIAAPAPPVKIAPVKPHQSTMHCVCGKNRLKQN